MTDGRHKPATEELLDPLSSFWATITPNSCAIIRQRLASLTAAKEAAEKQVTSMRQTYAICFDHWRAAEKQCEELRRALAILADAAFDGGLTEINTMAWTQAHRALASTSPKDHDHDRT